MNAENEDVQYLKSVISSLKEKGMKENWKFSIYIFIVIQFSIASVQFLLFKNNDAEYQLRLWMVMSFFGLLLSVLVSYGMFHNSSLIKFIMNKQDELKKEKINLYNSLFFIYFKKGLSNEQFEEIVKLAYKKLQIEEILDASINTDNKNDYESKKERINNEYERKEKMISVYDILMLYVMK